MAADEYNMKRVLQLDPCLKRSLERLKGITGFISIIGYDPRVTIFSRYNHISRVVEITNYISFKQKVINTERCILLAVLHDINRMPFAHLLEKQIGFHQEEYFDFYFKLIGFDPGFEIIKDLKDITQKKTNGSDEATLVFIADCVCGFIEDSLFAFSLFGVDPQKIPSKIANYLEYIKLPEIGGEMQNLKNRFELNNGFTEYFNRLVLKFSANFIRLHDLEDITKVNFNFFNELRQEIKGDLLLKEIFPVNNEIVSKGSFLFANFLLPYLDFLRAQKNDPIEKLLRMTDRDMLNDAEHAGVLKCRKEDLYPDLRGL